MYKISQNSYTVFFDFHHRFSARLVYDVRRSFSFDPRGKRVREKGEKIGGGGKGRRKTPYYCLSLSTVQHLIRSGLSQSRGCVHVQERRVFIGVPPRRAFQS